MSSFPSYVKNNPMITSTHVKLRALSWRLFLAVAGVLAVLIGLGSVSVQAGEPVEFNRDVRRILADNC